MMPGARIGVSWIIQVCMKFCVLERVYSEAFAIKFWSLVSSKLTPLSFIQGKCLSVQINLFQQVVFNMA